MRMVISFTTIPSRIEHIRPMLDSLMQQKRKPDEIYMTLPEKSLRSGEFVIKYKIPMFLRQYPITIVRIPYDYGPVCKILGGILSESRSFDCRIVTVDDDIVYPDTLLSDLEKYCQECPDCAVGFSGFRFIPDPPFVKLFTPLKNVEKLIPGFVKISHGDEVDILQGFAGVAYDPLWFDELSQIEDWCKESELLRSVDDCVLSAYLSLRGIRRRVFRPTNNLNKDQIKKLSNPLSGSGWIIPHFRGFNMLKNEYKAFNEQNIISWWISWVFLFILVILSIIVLVVFLVYRCKC